MDWVIKEVGYAPGSESRYGNKFITGNGFMGVRGTLDEYTAEQCAAINLAGTHDQRPGGWEESLNAPNPFYSLVEVEDAVCAVQLRRPETHVQWLDIQHGIMGRETCWSVPKGHVKLESRRFASLADPCLLAAELTITTDFDGEVIVKTGIDTKVWDINGPHVESWEKSSNGVFLTVSGVSQQSGIQVCTCEYSSADGQQDIVEQEGKLLRRFRLACKAGAPVAVRKFAAVTTSLISSCPMELGGETLEKAMQKGAEAVWAEHEQAWERFWKIAQVSIDGDEAAEQMLNYSLYQLECIAPRHSASMSIPARGLSGQTYKGAVFWDTEMFMLDFYLATQPEVARALIRYRIDTLDGAREKARHYGFEGAYYAWESQHGGHDACSDYNVIDVFTGRPMRTYFKDKQYHISGAVVLGIMKYLEWTGDDQLLAEGGYETILECAKFYLSLLVKPLCREHYELRDVIGPDEYHERVDNNAYTNRLAQYVMEVAIGMGETMQQKYPEEYQKLWKKLDLSRLMPALRDAAEHILIIQPRPEDQVIEQHTGYFDLEDTSVEEVKSRLLDPKEYWGGAYGVASHTQIIKQSDVVAMLVNMPHHYPREVLDANWNYYMQRTEHGSSLSATAYGLLACEIGKPEAAYEMFLKSASIDLTGISKEWAGLLYIGGTHPAANAGAWKVAVQGFAGLEVREGRPVVQNRLPENWKRIAFSFFYHGQLYRATLSENALTLEKTEELG